MELSQTLNHSFEESDCVEEPCGDEALVCEGICSRGPTIMAVASASTAFSVTTVSTHFVGLRGVRPSSQATPMRHAGVKSGRGCCQVRAFFDIQGDPIVKEVLKEPVAFLGGVFAGLLRLDLNEDPLREWVAKTSKAAGVKPEEDPESSSTEDAPNEIEIE